MKETSFKCVFLLLLAVFKDGIDCNDEDFPPGVHHQDDIKRNEWKIAFYTGDAVWAGTDSDIYVELIGDNGNSKVIFLRTSKNHMEAKSVDVFSLGDLDNRQIGSLKQIVVGKQFSYAFFNDWQLIKVEVFDPQGKKFTFNCQCWFTSTKFKRLIGLTSTESSNNNLNESYSIASRSSRVFPMTIALLFLFFILVSFTYFGKIMCNKWKESWDYYFHTTPGIRSSNNEEPDIPSRLMNRLNRNNMRSNNSPSNVDEHLNLNLSHHQQSNNVIVMEDKPPDYTELFPYPSNSATKQGETPVQQEEQPPQQPVVTIQLSSQSPQQQPATNQDTVTRQQTNDNESSQTSV